MNAQLIDAKGARMSGPTGSTVIRNDQSAAESEITGRLVWDFRRNLFAAASLSSGAGPSARWNAEMIAMRGWPRSPSSSAEHPGGSETMGACARI